MHISGLFLPFQSGRAHMDFHYIRLCEHALDLRKRFRAEDLVFPLNGAHDGHCAPDLSVHPQRKGHGQAAAEPFLIVHGVADAADQLQVFPELFLTGNGCARVLDELQTGQILRKLLLRQRGQQEFSRRGAVVLPLGVKKGVVIGDVLCLKILVQGDRTEP